MSGRVFPLALAAVVAIVVALAVAALDPPAVARAKRLDAQRTHDLDRISIAIDRDWSRNQGLAPDLTALEINPELRFQPLPVDPESGAAYVYRVTGERTYELCATFATECAEPPRDPSWDECSWRHPAGEHCLRFEAKRRP